MEGALCYLPGTITATGKTLAPAQNAASARLKTRENIDSPGAQKPADLPGAVKQALTLNDKQRS